MKNLKTTDQMTCRGLGSNLFKRFSGITIKQNKKVRLIRIYATASGRIKVIIGFKKGGQCIELLTSFPENPILVDINPVVEQEFNFDTFELENWETSYFYVDIANREGMAQDVYCTISHLEEDNKEDKARDESRINAVLRNVDGELR